MIGKKTAAAVVLGVGLLFTSACGEQELPEEVYKTAMNKMEALDSVYFTESNSLHAAQGGVSTFTRGAVQYNEPLEAFMDTDINLVDLSEPLELAWRVQGDKVEVREDEKWREYDAEQDTFTPLLRPLDDLRFFLSYENEFLMKEEEEYYEVSFKGTDERHHPLVEKKLESLGITEQIGGLDEKAKNSIQLDRIDMVAFIDKETKLLSGYDTRFTFTIELAGELRSFNERKSVRYDEFNNVSGDLETFIEKKVKEIQRKKMEEQEEEGNNESEEEI